MTPPKQAHEVTIVGPHYRPARTLKGPRQEVVAQMRINGAIRVSAAEALRASKDEPVVYHVVDLVTGDEVTAPDRPAAVEAFRNLYLSARRSLGVYCLTYQAPEGLSFEEALACYLGALDAVSRGTNYSITRGRKFLRVVQAPDGTDHRSAFAFIHIETGQVLAPNGWKGPSRSYRGNIFGTVINLPA